MPTWTLHAVCRMPKIASVLCTKTAWAAVTTLAHRGCPAGTAKIYTQEEVRRETYEMFSRILADCTRRFCPEGLFPKTSRRGQKSSPAVRKGEDALLPPGYGPAR